MPFRVALLRGLEFRLTIVRNDATCHQAATAYWSVLRKSVPDQFGKHLDTRVLVVQVGLVYLVDDLRSRNGRGAYWEVMIFNRNWQRLGGFGSGAQPNSNLDPPARN
jgi:hypothetical protein